MSCDDVQTTGRVVRLHAEPQNCFTEQRGKAKSMQGERIFPCFSTAEESKVL